MGSLGACSDDDGTDAADPTTTAPAEGAATTEATGPTDTEAPPAPLDPELEAAMREAMDRAEAANLVIDDLPAGWEHLPPAEGDLGPLETCTTVDLDEHLLGLYRSDSFSTSVDPGTLQVSSSATVLDTVQAAADVLADFRDDAFVACVDGLFNGSTDTYERTGTLTRNETAPDLGEEAVALSGDYVISPLDGSPDHVVTLVVVAVRTGDLVTVLNSTAVDRSLDEELVRTMLDVLVARQQP
jgi:hypothetical protein